MSTTGPAVCNGYKKLDACSPWTRRPDTPFKVMFNTVTINDAVYLFPDYMTKEVAYLHNYCNNEYVDIKNFAADCFKYDGITGKFSVFAHYPSTATSLYKTVSYDPQTNKCWVVGGTHDMFALFSMADADADDIKENAAGSPSDDDEKSGGDRTRWGLGYNFSGVTNTTGPLPVSIHVQSESGGSKSCKFHMIGGHNSRYHEVWDDKQRRMRPVYEFATRLKGRELQYVAQWDTLFMFGGCLWEGTDFKSTVRFRYINDFYRCRNPNDVEHIRWERMEGEQWKMPYNMMGFGHLLLDHTKLVIFGGRVAGGGYIDDIWMFDLATTQWFQSTLRIPQKGKYRAALIEGAGQIELFQYGHPALMNQAHFSIKVDALMASMKSVAHLPVSTKVLDTEKVRLHNVKVFEEQRNKFCPADKTKEEAIREVQSRKELSNRQKRKLIRKIRQKSWKYSKPSPGGTVAKRTSLLPVVNPVETVGDEEVSLSLERSPVTPPMNGGSSSTEFKLASDLDLKEDGDLEEAVRKLKGELVRVRAERDGLLKSYQQMKARMDRVEGIEKENKKLRELLADKGVSAM